MTATDDGAADEADTADLVAVFLQERLLPALAAVRADGDPYAGRDGWRPPPPGPVVTDWPADRTDLAASLAATLHHPALADLAADLVGLAASIPVDDTAGLEPDPDTYTMY